MIRIDIAVEIARPQQEVFAALTDLDRLPEWQASAEHSRADEPLDVGVRIHERRRLFGRELETELEVTAYEPPSRLALKALNGPVKFAVDHRLEADGQGTRLEVTAEAKPGGMLRFAGPMVQRQAETEMRADFESLKELLESGGYPSGAAPVD